MSILLNQLPGRIDDTQDGDHVYYQILVISYDHQHIDKHIKTKIVTKKRKDFKKYLLAETTKQNLLEYYPDYQPPKDSDEKAESRNSIGSYLPSAGVVFPEDFLKVLFEEDNLKDEKKHNSPAYQVINQRIVGLNNLYEPIQTLLQTRKISQLIAQTWYAYLTAKRKKDNHYWKSFITGNWENIETKILNGLIAREIFFFDEKYAPDELDQDNIEEIYQIYGSSLIGVTEQPNEKLKLLIPPSSRGWQGIALSLLLAGQVYYQVTESGETKYQQVHPPILSTGDIVFRYGLEVDWNSFKGTIKEMQLSPGKTSVASQATVPYPPIPYKVNLSREQIEEWAYAQDIQDEGDKNAPFPFYLKKDGKFLLKAEYFSPPYPYLPLSTC